MDVRLLVISLFILQSQCLRGDLEKYGWFELILHSHILKCNHTKNLELDVSDIGVRFYDFRHEIEVTFPIQNAAENILENVVERSDFTKTWVIYVPGFNSPLSGKTTTAMKDGFENLDQSYYIVIDHYVYTAASGSYIKSYEKAVSYAYDIAKAISKFVDRLQRGGVSLSNVRLIGHSLGSQILGYVGTDFKKSTGLSLRRITALDPAGPCFSNSFIEDQISSESAEYVEVFHCNAGGLGTTSVLADADFYANHKGEWQPKCHEPLVPELENSVKAAQCSHEMCVHLYAATVYHKEWFWARQCSLYKDFKNGNCGDVALAGFWSPGTARGVYYFSTKGYDF